MTRDPVCGMTVDQKTATASVIFKGTTYYFCCSVCKEKFEQEPEKYLRSSWA